MSRSIRVSDHLWTCFPPHFVCSPWNSLGAGVAVGGFGAIWGSEFGAPGPHWAALAPPPKNLLPAGLPAAGCSRVHGIIDVPSWGARGFPMDCPSRHRDFVLKQKFITTFGSKLLHPNTRHICTKNTLSKERFPQMRTAHIPCRTIMFLLPTVRGACF